MDAVSVILVTMKGIRGPPTRRTPPPPPPTTTRTLRVEDEHIIPDGHGAVFTGAICGEFLVVCLIAMFVDRNAMRLLPGTRKPSIFYLKIWDHPTDFQPLNMVV